MMDLLQPAEIEEKKKLLREGLYWEALGISNTSSMGKIDSRIFELTQAASEDQEFAVLLLQVRRHLATGSYTLIRKRYWDDLAGKLDEKIVAPVLGIEEEDISRQNIWKIRIDKLLNIPGPVSFDNIQSALAEHFRVAGFKLAEKGQELVIQSNTEESYLKSVLALKKSIYCLDIARTYAKTHIKDIIGLLNQASRIEQQLEADARLQEYRVPDWPEAQRNVIPGTIAGETVAVKPVKIDSKPPAPRDVPPDTSNQPPASPPAPPRTTSAQSHASDSPPATSNQVTQPQLFQDLFHPRDVPPDTVNQPPASPPTPPRPTPAQPHTSDSPPATSNQVTQPQSRKKRGSALPLSLFFGYLGADRFYLGLPSAWFKLCLFFFVLSSRFIPALIHVSQLFTIAFTVAVIWWLIDIILISGRWLNTKDDQKLA